MEKNITVFRSDHGQLEFFSFYDQLLEKWPVPFEEKYIGTAAGRTHVIVSGPKDAPVLFLLHALYASALSWYKNVEALSKHFRVYAIDMIGDPNRSEPVKPVRKDIDIADWLLTLMEAAGTSKASFAGNSVGGYHAAGFAVHHPEKVSKLVLVGPAGTFRQIWPFYRHAFLAGMTHWEFMIRHSIKWMKNGSPLDEEWLKLFYSGMKHGAGKMQVFPAVFSDEQLASVKIPVMLLLGDHEIVYDINKVITRAGNLIPGITIQVISNANHFTALSQPGPSNEAMVNFLCS